MTAPETPEASTAYEKFRATTYFSGLDALRAFSVIAVIWAHVTVGHSLALLTHGNKGVDFFFAISGFLVTTLLLREHDREGSISLGAFFVRRTLRIFPLYYAVLGLYIVLVWLTLAGTAKGNEFWANLPAFASYTSNWFVDLDNSGAHGVTFYFAWSLATEEQFYLFWPPLMVLLLKASGRPVVLVGATLLLLAAQAAAAMAWGGSFPGVVLGSLAPAILLGVALAVLLHDRASFLVIYRAIGQPWAAPLLLLAVLGCLHFGAPGNVSRLFMALVVASVCIREDTWLHPVLRWRPLVVIGMVSYGIYLMHMLSANLVRKLLHHEFGMDVFIGTVAVAVAAAYVSHRYFESPLLSLKGRLSPGKPRATRVPHPSAAAPGGWRAAWVRAPATRRRARRAPTT